MRIKTITCHDVYNSGASLQAYALMRYLEELGNEVEIIDYKPDYLNNHYKLGIIANPKYEKNLMLKMIYLTLKFPGRVLALRKKIKYDHFRDNYLKVTKKRYISNSELKNNPPEADIFICGSDQIWNSKFNNGKDPAFYLDFAPQGKIKASYAASFATDRMEESVRDITKERINKLDYIGVREISALNILEDLGIDNGIQVMDPVFLLSKETWLNMAYEVDKKQKYIFVYDFDGNELIKEIALKVAKKKSLKIYTVFKSDYSDKVIKGMGPIDFISYIKNAEFVISNSFHGTAFSIIFEKQFIVVNRKEEINTRMRDLLTILKIENRLINENYNFDLINKNIDYTVVNRAIKLKVKSSKEYLENIILNYDILQNN
ncbi:MULTISPECIES: polysaccharide pyruvyl transferase family protein [Clostridium]|uniref:polysaccharide pyruvyl transferase family protein n=1 Tax=Clostridium TaxID=1485 RepID=UPI0006C046EE|nr:MULTISPECIES: polysaccharide pyruvyl transferase family protein [Clostridium]CUO31274.1 Polysaccharide pyruvyl transferase [Clostridium disporicum]